jgi:CRP/FNR family transcriptional regulator, anaerobic regulatory protein
MNSAQLFFNVYPTIKVSKGEVIVQQNQIPNKAYAVKSGIVKVCNFTTNGEEKSLSFKVENDIFPVCWIFNKTKAALFYYQAHTDLELYVMSRDEITHHVNTDSDFARTILDRQIVSYVNSELQIEALEQSRAILKLIYTLRHLALTHGVEEKKDCVKIKIPLTQQELANFTGLTRETTVMELNKLKGMGIVSNSQKYYTINTTRASDFLDDEYDPGVTIKI